MIIWRIAQCMCQQPSPPPPPPPPPLSSCFTENVELAQVWWLYHVSEIQLSLMLFSENDHSILLVIYYLCSFYLEDNWLCRDMHAAAMINFFSYFALYLSKNTNCTKLFSDFIWQLLQFADVYDVSILLFSFVSVFVCLSGLASSASFHWVLGSSKCWFTLVYCNHSYNSFCVVSASNSRSAGATICTNSITTIWTCRTRYFFFKCWDTCCSKPAIAVFSTYATIDS